MEEKTVVPRSSVPLYIIIILVVLGILLLFFIVFGIICYKKQRKTFTKVKVKRHSFIISEMWLIYRFKIFRRQIQTFRRETVPRLSSLQINLEFRPLPPG